MATPTPSGPDPATQGVLEALNTLYYVQDPALKKKANEWLEEFQHSVCPLPRCKVGKLRTGDLDPRLVDMSFTPNSAGYQARRTVVRGSDIESKGRLSSRLGLSLLGSGGRRLDRDIPAGNGTLALTCAPDPI